MMDIEKVIWYFKKICSIPRASGDEEAICNYIDAFAKERGLDVTRDAHHNMIIKKPATIQGTGEPVILQGHMDMVYVKDEDNDHVYGNAIVLLGRMLYFLRNKDVRISDIDAPERPMLLQIAPV